MQPLTTPKQVRAFSGLVGFYQKFIKNFAKIAKPLTLLTRQEVKFDWTPVHHATFLTQKGAITQAPILCYPDPNWKYIVYTDASDDACRAQFSQEHNGTEFPIAFLSHTFTETQCKWNTMEQEAYGVYYAVTKWNYYLQGANVTVHNDHKPLARFLNGKNTNNKVNPWSLELASYIITFEWISGTKNKAADCLSRLVEHTPQITTPGNMLTVTQADGSAFHIRSRTKQDTTLQHPSTSSVTPDMSKDPSPTPKSLTADRLDTLLQMQKTDPFCKHISKRLLNRKVPKCKTDVFTYSKGLPYKHVTESGKQFLALVIPKSWKYTVLVEADDKFGHQGNTHTYCLIKRQYY